MSRGISQSDQPIERSGDGTDLFSKFDDIIALREGLLASGQEDPFSLVMEKVLSPTRAICNGRETILLGTYNYMGMTFDPDVIEAVRGEGLLIGLKAKVPNGELVAQMREEGLLAVPAGDNVVRLLPPLNVTADEVRQAMDRIETAVAAMSAGNRRKSA